MPLLEFLPSSITPQLPLPGKLGRRIGAVLFLGTIAVSCLLVLVVGLDSEWVNTLAMVGKFGAAGAFATVYIFATELFPTEALYVLSDVGPLGTRSPPQADQQRRVVWQVRALCMGMASMFARFGALATQPLIAIGGYLPMVAFGLVCLIVSVAPLPPSLSTMRASSTPVCHASGPGAGSLFARNAKQADVGNPRRSPRGREGHHRHGRDGCV